MSILTYLNTGVTNLNKSVNVVLIAGILVLSVLLCLDKCGHDNGKDKANLALIAALQDSVRHFKDKEGNNVAQILAIQTESAKAFTKLSSSDSVVKDLQKTVSDYKSKLKAGSSVTNALIETVAELKGRKPEIKYLKGDTVVTGGVTYLFPTYKDSLNNKWVSLSAEMGKDTSVFHLTVQNKFSAIVGVDHKKPFVDLITENPYSTVKTLRTYQVSMPRPKRFGIGISIGGTYSYSTNKIIPYAGIGVNYNIINLW